MNKYILVKTPRRALIQILIPWFLVLEIRIFCYFLRFLITHMRRFVTEAISTFNLILTSRDF